MSFIDKKDPTVINIKITSKGRELLSQGKLSFDYFSIGDSEIDYNFINNTGIKPYNLSILKPVDKNPEFLSYVTQIVSGSPYNIINTISSIPSYIVNSADTLGFFDTSSGETKFYNDTKHVKQPDVVISGNTVTGGTYLHLSQAPTYGYNVYEPAVNDILMIKWANPTIDYNTTGYTVNSDIPTPYIFYKIEEVISGTSLANNDLIVRVDREVPDFTLYSGSSFNNLSGAIVFYNFNNYTGDTVYSLNYRDDAIRAFLQNYECPTIIHPFWDLSIIYTENIAGVQLTGKTYGDYNTNMLGGFVSYIQNQEPIYKKLGVIHYTNYSPANTYAEGFHGDPQQPEDNIIPTLDIPYVMWHKKSTSTLGIKLKATGELKYLTGKTKSLNIKYYDLTDKDNNIVGKVFYELKIFVIEDQELLFLLSYKSNRSWSLPELYLDVNATHGCPLCLLRYDVSNIPPTTINGDDAVLIIDNIRYNTGSFDDGKILLEIITGATDFNDPNGVRVFFDSISGETVTFTGVTAGDYLTRIYDLGSSNCIVTGSTSIESPQSVLSIIDTRTTNSNLKAYFDVDVTGATPTEIVIYKDDVVYNDFYGSGYTTIVDINDPTAIDLNNRDVTGTTDTILKDWVLIDLDHLVISGLTVGGEYYIYVRDITTSDISSGEETQVWSFYKASIP